MMIMSKTGGWYQGKGRERIKKERLSHRGLTTDKTRLNRGNPTGIQTVSVYKDCVRRTKRTDCKYSTIHSFRYSNPIKRGRVHARAGISSLIQTRNRSDFLSFFVRFFLRSFFVDNGAPMDYGECRLGV